MWRCFFQAATKITFYFFFFFSPGKKLYLEAGDTDLYYVEDFYLSRGACPKKGK